MPRIKNLVVCCFFLVLNCSGSKLLLIELGRKDQYLFNNFITQAEKAGFAVDFSHLSDCCPESLSQYDAIFITFDHLIVLTKGPLQQKFVILLEYMKSLRSKMIGFILPAGSATNHDIVQYYSNLCNYFCDDLLPEHQQVLDNYIQLFLKPENTLRSHYSTALLLDNSTPLIPSPLVSVQEQHSDGFLKMATLPLEHRSEKTSGAPIALYIKNSGTDNHFVLTKRSLLTFSDIEENFLFNPIDHQYRDALAGKISVMLHQLYGACCANVFSRFSYKKVFDDYLEDQNTDYISCDKKIWCGWIDPKSYYNKEKKSLKNLMKMGLNIAWVEWNPECYLSANGINKSQKDNFFNNISKFTTAFSQEKNNLDYAESPLLFVGTDITTNFSRAKVVNPVHDMCGNVYTKIPSPLDFKNFWKTEVLDVFDALHKAWTDRIGNGVPLSGIFFDFEMYHAQDQSGQYTPLMDFSPLAWRCYVKKRPEAGIISEVGPVHDRVNYLMQQQKFDDYFTILKNKVCRIGQKIKNHLYLKEPNLTIAAYNLQLPHSWFYQGMLQGLSSVEKPIIMATFNNEFMAHKKWLEDQKIYLQHLPVILLSKLTKKADFSLINRLANNNDGVWFNRISRLEESRDPSHWFWDYTLEVSPLATDEFIEYLRLQLEKIKQ